MTELFVRIPEDRLAVLIGVGGVAKKAIEDRSGAHLEIDTADGSVRITSPPDSDPWGALKARDAVVAIGRGFSPQRALRLLTGENYITVLNMREVTGKRDKNAVRRIRSRLIGEKGKARERLEELSGCSISIYGYHVAIIGSAEELERGTRALTMLLRGSEHATVFGYLAGERQRSVREEIEP
ncbi:MAG: KH domain-containing protein [Candidatus Thermoplasmatota archaeon]|jgi:ribosomal RNA assembly protein|nr:KH domain-containing protein [Candidatus Thermoplasmatota archaeon]MCL5984742.1 KH domain-containing protein [Candidatus Thermoplasmatota archaeon]